MSETCNCLDILALETSTLARLADPRSIRTGDPSSAIITLAGFMSLQKEKKHVSKHLQHILHFKRIFRDYHTCII